MTILCISRCGRVFSFEWDGLLQQEVSMVITDKLSVRKFAWVPPVTEAEHELLLYEEVSDDGKARSLLA